MRREAGLRGEDPYQCVKNVAVFSISMFGTLKEMTSYGSAAKSRYWYLRSQGSFFCSKALMKRCLGFAPSSISGYSTCSRPYIQAHKFEHLDPYEIHPK